MKTQAPYGQTFPLLSDLTNVECWNFTDNSRYTLPKGTMLKVEHVNDATHTTCMVIVPKPPLREDGCQPADVSPIAHNAWRFIVENQALAAAIGVPMPKKTADLVGDIIAYESGTASPKRTKKLFSTLRKTGIGRKLQGHYSSRM